MAEYGLVSLLLLYQAVNIETLVQLMAAHGYLILFVAITLECAALPIPGELLLLSFGALAVQGRLDPVLGIIVAASAVVLGDSLSYSAGRFGGQRLLGRIRLARRWTPGDATIVFGRFVVGARVAVAPLAGAQRRHFGRFVAFDAVGAVIWAGLFVILGYVAGSNVAALQRGFTSAVSALQLAVVGAAAAWLSIRVLHPARARRVLCAALLALACVRAAVMPTDAPALVPSRAGDDGAALPQITA
jgi:membrane protein DedA with SNARE-associated domain